MSEFHKLRVFLCHASQDKPVVRELYKRLSAEVLFDVWLDEERLLLGHNWNLEIEKVLEKSDVVIVCLSSRSVTKEGYVQKELRLVLDIALEKPEGAIFLIPFRLEDCDIPRGLKQLHRADYFGEKKEQSYKDLLVSLTLRREQVILRETKEKARIEAEGRNNKEKEEALARKAAEEKLRPKRQEQTRKEIEEELRRDEEEKEERTKSEIQDAEIGKVVRSMLDGIAVLWQKFDDWKKKEGEKKKQPIGTVSIANPFPSKTEPMVIDVVPKLTGVETSSFISSLNLPFKLAIWVATVLATAVFIKVIFITYGLQQVALSKNYWVPLACGFIALAILKTLQTLFINRFIDRGVENSVWWSVNFYVCQIMIISGSDFLQIVSGAFIVVLLIWMAVEKTEGCLWFVVFFIGIAMYSLNFSLHLDSPFVMVILNETYFGLSGLYKNK